MRAKRRHVGKLLIIRQLADSLQIGLIRPIGLMGLIGRITPNNQQKHIKLTPFGRAGVGVGWLDVGCRPLFCGYYMSDAAYFVL